MLDNTNKKGQMTILLLSFYYFLFLSQMTISTIFSISIYHFLLLSRPRHPLISSVRSAIRCLISLPTDSVSSDFSLRIRRDGFLRTFFCLPLLLLLSRTLKYLPSFFPLPLCARLRPIPPPPFLSPTSSGGSAQTRRPLRVALHQRCAVPGAMASPARAAPGTTAAPPPQYGRCRPPRRCGRASTSSPVGPAGALARAPPGHPTAPPLRHGLSQWP